MNKSKSPCLQNCENVEKCKKEKGEKLFRVDMTRLIFCEDYKKHTDTEKEHDKE